MLNRIRGALQPYLLRVGEAASKLGLSPTGWSLLGLLFSALSAAAYSGLVSGGSFVAGLSLLAAGFLDLLDGAVAKATGSMSSRGACLDSTFDRVGEILVFFGVLQGGTIPSSVVILALSFSLMVSYVRARGEALGVQIAGVGLGERAERMLLLVVFTLAGQLFYGVLIVAVLAAATFVQRTSYMIGMLNRRGRVAVS